LRTVSLSVLLPGLARHREVAGQAEFVFQEVADAARVGLAGHHREVGGAEEVLRDLRHRSHTGLMVVCFSRSMKGSGSRCSRLAQLAQEGGGAVQADRRLQVGRSSASHSMRPYSRYMQMLTSASTRRDTSARWLPSGNTMFTSAPMPCTRRRISARSLGMLKVP
jgi:hypothetical protein